MELTEAVRIAIREVKDPYALTYLKAIPVSVEEYGSEGLSWQLSYALLNMGKWKGDEARIVKGVFKQTIRKLDKAAKAQKGGAR